MREPSPLTTEDELAWQLTRPTRVPGAPEGLPVGRPPFPLGKGLFVASVPRRRSLPGSEPCAHGAQQVRREVRAADITSWA